MSLSPAPQVPILVVEDDRHALSGYLEFLATAGFDPIGVEDAVHALPLALCHPPEAIVTDITLPGMNGFEFAAALRSDARTRDLPIIGITGHWSPEVRTRATACACTRCCSSRAPRRTSSPNSNACWRSGAQAERRRSTVKAPILSGLQP